MEYDSIYENLKNFLAKTGGKFSILEDQINVDLQVEFFELANKYLKERRSADDIISAEKILNDKLTSFDDKKNILVELSNNKRVEAYRIIEKYIKTATGDVKAWAILALQNARIGLESDLLDEQQIFISTGLGGRGENLRYFIACKLKSDNEFSESQKKIIKNEFEYSFKLFNSVIEKIDFKKEYFTIIGLIPISTPISDVIVKAISEVNNYGDFLYEEYLVTNVKLLDVNDIIHYFKKKGV